VVAASRRGQPAPAAGAWPCPPGWGLGAGLTTRITALPDRGLGRAFQATASSRSEEVIAETS
jgi:hypothetical protein